MISAPTGGRPKVMRSSIATVAMVPMPGSTPTSVPTSAPTRHSRRLIGENATPKPRARLEKRSAITPSLDQETREELQRQPERIGEKQAATDGQADTDDDGFGPFRLVGSQRRNDEARERRDHETQRPDRDRKGKDRERYEQRTAPMIDRKLWTIGQQTHHGYAGAKRQHQYPEHPRRGTGAERKAAHALQIARRPQREQRQRHQDDATEIILRRLQFHEQ